MSGGLAAVSLVPIVSAARIGCMARRSDIASEEFAIRPGVQAEDRAVTMIRNRLSSFLYGGNAPYIEDQYEQYLAKPDSVSDEWKTYFDALRATPAVDGSDARDVAHGPVVDHFVALAKRNPSSKTRESDLLAFAGKQVAVQSLIGAYRQVGTRTADLEPLRWSPPPILPELSPAFYGLSQADLNTRFNMADTFFWEQDATLGDLVDALRQTYCGTLSAEFMHLGDAEHRRWWQMRLETSRSKPKLPVEKKVRILERLTAAEGLEKYLHVRYVGQKRFSLEGGESLIVLLDELIQTGATHGVQNVVMGMAHRGRLNVLVNTTGKPAHMVFNEFEGNADKELLAGDVKYHKGYTGVTQTPAGSVEVLLAYNPSHLEIINPVVQGIARAKAEGLGLQSAAVLPVEIHGDAAIAGQGIVQETLAMTYTQGHGNGGTIHVVVNNQVGFTTSDPRDARSSFYCTDITKSIEAPVLHVNGDDPEAVVLAAQLALEYRATFARSVVIELVCFRRHGHQEQDTPNMTQPLMYRAIAAHQGVRSLYAKRLVADWLVTEKQVEKLVLDHREELDGAKGDSDRSINFKDRPRLGEKTQGSDITTNRVYYAAPTPKLIRELAERITSVPDGHKLHPLVAKVMDSRREMAKGKKALDWGMGEHMAFATLLASGTDVRLSGQDSERGTFGHRHAALHNQNRETRAEGKYIPLDHVSEGQGRFRVTNSILSEAAVLAFEYGYSVTRPTALTLWEAQFGDFANGAQVVMDQFISAGHAKWGQRASLVLLLPHGQEGQGPEHASARLERYLQLCAQENMLVCQPSTPAQFFHLLRAQVVLPDRRPLIVMTPKSLLRHPEAVSALEDLAKGSFAPVIGDPFIKQVDAFEVSRVIVCSGKAYYELLERRRKSKDMTTALVRLEQLYPYPESQIEAELARYPNARVVVWCQEEAMNQGAWGYIEPRLRVSAHPAPLQYAGPAAAASTAPGSASVFNEYQEALLKSAFED